MVDEGASRLETSHRVCLLRPDKVYLIGDGVRGFLVGDGYTIVSKSFGYGDSQIQFHDMSLGMFVDEELAMPVPVSIRRHLPRFPWTTPR